MSLCTTGSRHHESTPHHHSPSKHSQTATPRHQHLSHRPLPPPPPQMYPYPQPPLPLPPQMFPYPYLAIPPPMHGSTSPWGMYPSHGYHPPFQSFQPPPSSPLKPPQGISLEKSLLPCVCSYATHYQNGIPPHSTSRFFKQLWGKLSAPAGRRNGFVRSNLSSPLREVGKIRKSPSNISAALSEPPPNHRLYLSRIPHREISGHPKSYQHSKGDKTSAKMSSKPKSNVQKSTPQKVPKRNIAEEIDEEERGEPEQLSTHSSKQRTKETNKGMRMSIKKYCIVLLEIFIS